MECGRVKESSMESIKPADVQYSIEDYGSWDKLFEENRISKLFKEAIGQFTFQSGSYVLSAEEVNINFSPICLYYAIALAGCGAEGETAAQILSSLRIQDRDQLARQCMKLYQWFYYKAQRWECTVRLGNSLWISNQLKLKEGYQKMAASQFFSLTAQVDFNGKEAEEKISKWITEQTNGVLQPTLQLNSSTLMVILNTLYFYGSWRDVFFGRTQLLTVSRD